MAKVFFELPGYYEGLKARRIKQSGRLWLVKIVNDPPPYWFVIIKGFSVENDRKSGGKSIGVWRFQREGDAVAKFKGLEPLYPPFAARLPSEKQLAARRAFTEGRKSSNIIWQAGKS